MAPVGVEVAFQMGTGKKGKGVEGGRRNFRQPRGIRLCADGSLLVADFGNHCVLRFKPGDRKGKVVAGEEGKALPAVDPMKDIDKAVPLALPEEEGILLKQPGDVCEDPEGGVLVLDTEEGSVQRFAAKQGTTTLVPIGGKTVGRSLGSPDTVKGPRGVLLAPDGALIICDTWSHRVLRFAPAGSPEAAEPPTVLAGAPNSCGRRADQLAFPSACCLRGDGALLVSDTNNHRVQCFQPGATEGITVAGSADGERGADLGRLDMPTGICLERDGSLLVADRANARVLRFAADSRAGDPGEVVAGPDLVERPWGVCLGPYGAVYVSDERRALVLRLEVCGSPGGKEGPSPPAQPAAAAPPPEADVPAGPVGGGANTLD